MGVVSSAGFFIARPVIAQGRARIWGHQACCLSIRLEIKTDALNNLLEHDGLPRAADALFIASLLYVYYIIADTLVIHIDVKGQSSIYYRIVYDRITLYNYVYCTS